MVNGTDAHTDASMMECLPKQQCSYEAIMQEFDTISEFSGSGCSVMVRDQTLLSPDMSSEFFLDDEMELDIRESTGLRNESGKGGKGDDPLDDELLWL
ncbi:hypothetical protein FRC18_010121 [Serendipita sp. 400]|nr:hypothetical protein FRC18_010121 [Serendipita sp. 400]